MRFYNGFKGIIKSRFLYHLRCCGKFLEYADNALTNIGGLILFFCMCVCVCEILKNKNKKKRNSFYQRSD